MPYETILRMHEAPLVTNARIPHSRGHSDCAQSNGMAGRRTPALPHDNLAFADLESRPWALVDARHPIPRGFCPRLEALEGDLLVNECAAEPARRMLAACRAAGLDPHVTSAWRSRWHQARILARRLASYLRRGLPPQRAWALARQFVALPGTSEHELGLAIDVCSRREDVRAHAQVQAWLQEHGWRFGFVRRYPGNKAHVTGVAYEPWHFRYVGLDAARELHRTGECLEELLARTEPLPR